MDIFDAEKRYHTDPAFHNLVSVLYKMLAEQQCTRGDIIAAAHLAAYKVEMRLSRCEIQSNQVLKGGGE